MSPANSRQPRRIALVDCNNFYVSCERVFNPAWAQRPLGVLSNNDGCLIARSDELKAAGIPMGAPYFQYRAPLKAMGAVIVSSNYALYGDMSARVMDTLWHFTPALEIYSIDEAWLDLTGFDTASLDAYGRTIVATVQQHTGIPVSIGMAPTKVLAKIANRTCKKHKIPGQVFNLGNAAALDTLLEAVDVADIWGIGDRWAQTLRQQGIHTARALRDSDPQTMRRRYSVVMQRLILELRGIPCLGYEDIAPKKQIRVSRSFKQRVTALEALQEAVALHVSRAAEKMRQQQTVCGVLQVALRTGKHKPAEPFYGRSALLHLPAPTADTRTLIHAARRGIESIFKAGVGYAKVGVMLSDITPAALQQGTLFARGDGAKDQRLMQLIDTINQRHGRKTLFFAAQGITQPWGMKRGHRTQAYTTRWTELPRVR